MLALNRSCVFGSVILFILSACGGGGGGGGGGESADTIPPEITVLGNNPVTVEALSMYVDAGASATDAVDGNITVTTSGTVDTGTVASYQITYTATDAAGNSVDEIRTVNVVDTTAPVITVLGSNPVTVEALSMYVDAGASATDAVDGSVTVTTSGTVDTGTVASYQITYTATDAAGNSVDEIRTVNVVDTTAPVITVLGNNPVTVEALSMYVDAGASATDAVDGSVTITTSGTVDTGTLASYQITYTATDAAGNSVDEIRTVNVVDTTAPVISIAGTNPVSVKRLSAYVDAGATAVDLLDGSVSVTTSGSVDTSTVGIYEITYTAEDAAGNSINEIRTVNVTIIGTARVFTTGGALGTTLSPGLVDVDGDGQADNNFVSFGVGSGFLDATSGFGLVGNIGGSPGSGAAWVRSTSTDVTEDGNGRNEIIAPFRGALLNSSDNWSKVHYTTGDGWVQWEFGATQDIVKPLVFVREGINQDLSAAQAAALAYPTQVVDAGGALGTNLSPGLVDVDGDGQADNNFVSFGVGSGFLDATSGFGLVGNIGGSPGSGAAWVRSTSTDVTEDGNGRNEIIAPFRGALLNSSDNWSKVHYTTGDGWVQWEFGATQDIVKPLVFVREGINQDLSAAQAAALAYPTQVVDAGGALGTNLSPGLIDVDGDGQADNNFVSFGVDSGFLDATSSFGLVGNIGGSPGSGAAWVRSTSTDVTEDGNGRNEIIAPFRGVLLNSSDNWSKVHYTTGDGWVQWEFGATQDIVKPLVFVREGINQDLSAAQAAALAYPTQVVDAGGALGTNLSPGLVDVDGDGQADNNFVSFGVGSGFLDATSSFGLVGNIGGSPGSGAAWVRSTSTDVTEDGNGRNEIIAPFRGALLNSSDNWSKVHYTTGDGWVQWEFGATQDIVKPLVFVREGINQDLSAAQAAALAYPTQVVDAGGALGTNLSPGLVDVDGDGQADNNFVSFGVDSGFLDATSGFGLVGNIGGSPGSGAAWVRSTSTDVTEDGNGRNEIIAPFRGALLNSSDNWSKVHYTTGDGWVQWEFGATQDIVKPLVFVREGINQDLSAAEAEAVAYE